MADTICARAAALETAVWEKGLDEGQLAELREHANECDVCAEILRGIEISQAGLRELKDEEIPVPPADTAWEKVSGRLEESWAARVLRRNGWLKIAASVVLVVGLGAAIFHGNKAEQELAMNAASDVTVSNGAFPWQGNSQAAQSEEAKGKREGENYAADRPEAPTASLAPAGGGQVIAYSYDRVANYQTPGGAITVYDVATPAPPPAAADRDEAPRVERAATMALKVADARESFKRVSGMVAEAGGRIITSEIAQPSTAAGARSFLTARIPVAKFDGFIAELHNLGTIDSENIQGNDRTDAYSDVAGKIADKDAAIAALRAKLAAGNVPADQIRQIEAELARIRRERDALETSRRTIADRTDYATLTLTLTETRSGAGLSIVSRFWESIGSSCATAAEFAGWGLSIIVVGVGATLPWLVIAYLGWRLYRRLRYAW